MMKHLFAFILLLLHVGLFAQSPEMIFHSGFEPSVDTIDHDSSSLDIIGIDASVSTPNDWVDHLDNHPNIGYFKVQFQGGDEHDRLAEIVPDPEDPFNNALQFWVLNPNSGNNGRVQANIYQNNGLYNLFYSVRMYLPADFNVLKNAPFDFDFMTLMEFWNNANWSEEDHMFRVKVNLAKVIEEPDSLRIRVTGETRNQETDQWDLDIWEFYNTDFVVPVQQWMTLKVYFQEGDDCTGRFILSITPDGEAETIVHDVRNYTHHPDDPSPDGLSHFNPMKMYTDDEIVEYVTNSGNLLNIFWDDFELWKDVPLPTGGACLAGGITFGSQEDIDDFATYHPDCKAIQGDVTIHTDGMGTDISNLDGLSQITSIHGDLRINSNNSLTNLNGLENLSCVDGGLSIVSNNSLENLSALNNLRSIHGSLQITNNASLLNLDGLQNIASIAGSLTISYNNTIESLAGLDNINHATITNLIIENSSNLAFCELQNICEYLDNGGTYAISGNAQGCNTFQDVNAACLLVLPVELVHFSGKAIADNVLLSWQTASEINNDFFELEHSSDGRIFQPIGKIQGNGTTSESRNYKFLHHEVKQGMNYYRLKQVDFDGGYEYSEIISVEMNFDEISIQPNPTNGIVEIRTSNETATHLKVTDGMGRLIQSIELMTPFQTVNLSNQTKGIYFFIIQTSQHTIVKRIIKN